MPERVTLLPFITSEIEQDFSTKSVVNMPLDTSFILLDERLSTSFFVFFSKGSSGND